jgi:molybdopterin synthase sulfur carrier subunit
MDITVKLVGAFRHASGKGKISIPLKKAVSLKKAIEALVEEFPTLRRVLVDAELEDPRPNALILVNGKEISVLNGLETVLKDGDEVVFVPVIHGG